MVMNDRLQVLSQNTIEPVPPQSLVCGCVVWVAVRGEGVCVWVGVHGVGVGLHGAG